MNKEDILKEQKRLDIEIQKIWSKSAGLDGIGNIDCYLEWAESKSKILWILKEAGKPSINDGNAYDYRKRFVNAADYSKWKLTWGNIAWVSLGIHLYCEKVCSDLTAENLPEFQLYPEEAEPHTNFSGTEYYPLSDIALINVKKEASNKSTSNQADIIEEYLKPGVKEIISSQIKYINPDIIIMGCKVPKLAEDITGKKMSDFEIIDNNKLTSFYDDGKKVYIYTHHPNIMGLPKGVSRNDYINSIFSVIKKVGY